MNSRRSGATEFGTDVTGEVVGDSLDDSAGDVVVAAPGEGAVSVELSAECGDIAFDFEAVASDKLGGLWRERRAGVLASRGDDCNAAFAQGSALLLVGCVRIVGDQQAFEIGFEKSVKPADIVAFAGDLTHVGNQAMRGVNQMFAHAAEPAASAGATADFPEPAQTAVACLGAGSSADVNRVGVDDEKGGWPSPARVHSAPQSFCSSGVSSTRRSAKFCRESWRGKSALMVGCARSH